MDTDRHPTDANPREETIPEHFFRELHLEFLIHELKDPLAVAEAGLRSLLEKPDKFGPVSPRQEQILRRVLRSMLKSRSMVNTLLEVGRSEAEQFLAAPFFAGKAIYASLLDVLEMMHSELFTQVSEQQTAQQALAVLHEAGIVVHRVPEVDDIELIQDPTQFSQIVGNLLKNALRFRRERVDIRMDQNGDRLLVDISDDGPGIKPENHALIFRRYAQIDAEGALARKGHGLGLAGALILAQRMGGHLTVQSEAGQGATFRLTLPIKIAIDTSTQGG
jgi:two-component system, OmpR family, sensor kinase